MKALRALRGRDKLSSRHEEVQRCSSSSDATHISDSRFLWLLTSEAGQAGRSRRTRQRHFADFLKQLPTESEIAIESTGHWYWLVDEMERAGHHVHLANPMEAKKRMGRTNKTDALDAKGLAILLRNGTLPESWIPPGPLRDRRELLRTRMALRDLRSSLKHRIHAPWIATACTPIPSPISSESKAVNILRLAWRSFRRRRRAWCKFNSMLWMNWPLTSRVSSSASTRKLHPPRGPTFTERARRGEILAPVIWLEIGDVNRFPRAENLASYAGSFHGSFPAEDTHASVASRIL